MKATPAEIADLERRMDCQPAKRGAALPIVPLPTRTLYSTFSIKLPNPLNGQHGHWSVTNRCAREQRDATALALIGVPATTWAYLAAGCVVKLTRISAGVLDDDSLPAAFKHVRDQVAVFLFGGQPGERDSDPRAEWRYGQLRGLPRKPGVILSIRSTGDVT